MLALSTVHHPAGCGIDRIGDLPGIGFEWVEYYYRLLIYRADRFNGCNPGLLAYRSLNLFRQCPRIQPFNCKGLLFSDYSKAAALDDLS